MSGHAANPIFFNKKNKDWTSRILAKPSPPTSDNISFLPPPIPIPLKVYVTCVSPHIQIQSFYSCLGRFYLSAISLLLFGFILTICLWLSRSYVFPSFQYSTSSGLLHTNLFVKISSGTNYYQISHLELVSNSQ